MTSYHFPSKSSHGLNWTYHNKTYESLTKVREKNLYKTAIFLIVKQFKVQWNNKKKNIPIQHKLNKKKRGKIHKIKYKPEHMYLLPVQYAHL